MLKNPVMLELNLKWIIAVTENYLIFIIGITTSLIEIDCSKRVKISYFMQ